MNIYVPPYLGIVFLVTAIVTNQNTAIAESKSLKEKRDNCEQKLSLEEFRAFALNHSPLVAEIDRDYANSLAEAFEVQVLSNPEFQAEQTFTGMQLEGDNDPQVEVSISQPIRISDLGSRDKVSSLIRKSGDVQNKADILEFTQKLIVQYRTLYVFQKTEKILLDAEMRAANKISLIQKGVKKGLFSKGEEKLFEGERFRIQARRKGVSAAISTLQNKLINLTGYPCSIVVAKPTPSRKIPSVDSLVNIANVSQISEISRLNLLTSLREEQILLANLDTYPKTTPRLIYQHSNDGGDFFGAGISIPLQFWNRNQSEQTRAKAKHKAAKVRSDFLVNGRFKSKINNLRDAAINSQEQADIFLQNVIPAFGAALEAQEKLYSQGKGNVIEVWQTLRTLNEVQSQGLLLWLEAISIRVQLSLLVGEEI